MGRGPGIHHEVSGRAQSGHHAVEARRELVESREAVVVTVRAAIDEQMLFALEEFDQRALDVIIALVAGLEGEVLEASFRFPLGHRNAIIEKGRRSTSSARAFL